MPTRPTTRMRDRAAGWLTDRVQLETVTPLVPTRAQMSADDTATETDDGTVPASIRLAAAVNTPGVDRERAVTDVTVWLRLSETVVAGQTMTVTECAGDGTLVGKVIVAVAVRSG